MKYVFDLLWSEPIFSNFKNKRWVVRNYNNIKNYITEKKLEVWVSQKKGKQEWTMSERKVRNIYKVFVTID